MWKYKGPRITKIIFKRTKFAGCQRLMPVILATQEAVIRRTAVLTQSRQIVHQTLSRKNPSHKKTGGVAQGI
jgi:hypothetical protein